MRLRKAAHSASKPTCSVRWKMPACLSVICRARWRLAMTNWSSSPISKMIAVRIYKRAQTVGDVTEEEANAALAKAGMDAEEAEAIYHLTSLPTYQERFVIPPYSREGDIEETYDPQQRKAETGFGRRQGRREVCDSCSKIQPPRSSTHLPPCWNIPADCQPCPGMFGVAKSLHPEAADMVEPLPTLLKKIPCNRMRRVVHNTFDMQPVCYPYVGYQLFGESYKRGAFMAQLNEAYHAIGYSAGQELPDHLPVILRFHRIGFRKPLQANSARHCSATAYCHRWKKCSRSSASRRIHILRFSPRFNCLSSPRLKRN
jgi:hypothetical protein